MCGRFYIPGDDSNEELQQIINSLNRVKVTPVKTGEVCPTDVAAVIANSKAMKPTPLAMKWGYTLENRAPIINAHSESASTKPLLQDGMQQRRCLIPASQYFEWERMGKQKVKNTNKPTGSEAMYMAGIYRICNGQAEFTILTREPGEGIRHIHDRMPVILPRAAARDWLNPACNAMEVLRTAVAQVEFRPVDGVSQVELWSEDEASESTANC